ncbi:peptide chain release factor N(5)-glutamine methyltransferase [Oceanivirga miroungae]|uniref:Release factor glutamine methyltransferase n=1 Tax=Oceanivirga miroungae TaxID=1130046 RepID=A0A6I8MBC7_9FUSO|nr:peptide chain release factor N(5)-glutamine methyltransferase [Oceanivirga miroungae]VWL84785.1 HemK family modification methylase [Oceanivirga miroungae]
MEKLIDLLNKTVKFFEKKNYDKPRLEAEKLFSKALNMDRLMLYTNHDKILTDSEKEKIRNLLSYDKDEIKEDNLKSFLDSSIVYLNKHNIKEARLISELVFSKILNINQMMLFLEYSRKLNEDEIAKIRNSLKKIAIDKLPYQYIFNEQNFYGRNFFVDKSVLIPRYDTENLVEKVIEISKEKDIILDIGTGSGAIAITLAIEIKDSKVLAIDISDAAINIANKNIELLNAKNVKVIKSDLFQNVSYNKFNIIVSNPPYISNNEIVEMGLDTYIHEPHEALFAESNGLYFYYEIAKKAKDYLLPGGYLAFEIGYKQKNAINKILEEFSYVDIKNYKDLNGLDRVIIARKDINEHK